MLAAVTITRLEKAATDNGFDLELEHAADWLSFGSSQTSIHIWLTATGESRFLAAASRSDVLDGLADLGAASNDLLPSGAAGALGVSDIAALHRLLRRAFQLSRTLPDGLLHVFEAETANLPRATEAERLVIQRVGQDIFRRGLLEYWDGRCAITGLDVPDLLRASHIKPWAVCDTDAERHDVFNGLLLAPHLDAAFDSGFITIAEDGTVLLSDALPSGARLVLGLDEPLNVHRLHRAHERYPYGPVELNYVTAMISDVALECLLSPPTRSFSRVFVTSQRRIDELGARWSDEWLAEHGNDDPGIRTVDRPWLRTTCPACRNQPAEEAA